MFPTRYPFPFVHSTKTLDRSCVVMPAGWDSLGKTRRRAQDATTVRISYAIPGPKVRPSLQLSIQESLQHKQESATPFNLDQLNALSSSSTPSPFMCISHQLASAIETPLERGSDVSKNALRPSSGDFSRTVQAKDQATVVADGLRAIVQCSNVPPFSHSQV